MNSTELNINLKALKKLDPYILSIEATSAQVALYEYSEKKGDWEKMEIEGTLFVYQREADPQYGFTVMNRLNIKNMVQPLTRDLEFQLQSPFLMYRNTSNAAIYSLWFFDQVCPCPYITLPSLSITSISERERDNYRVARKEGQG